MVSRFSAFVKPWKSNFTNCFSWRTNRRIVVIESDDWGSIRMPSKQVLERLFLSKGINPGAYERVDALERRSDVEPLLETLAAIRDVNGNHPVITANTVVANPDFERIRESDFSQYDYEPFTKTYHRYEAEDVWATIKQGIKEKLYFPQFHGREHVNVAMWLQMIRNGNQHLQQAFEEGTWSVPKKFYPESPVNIQASFDGETNEALTFQKEALSDGLNLFEEIFGFRSRSFIANNFTWSSALNETLLNNGVDILQGMVYQKLPVKEGVKRKMIRHRTGEINALGQTYLVRNCVFEPAQEKDNFDAVTSCLHQVANAFLWNTPAIITSHRLNFIGSIDRRNQERNLKSFSQLLNKIHTLWPDVEFLNSAELGQLILDQKRNG